MHQTGAQDKPKQDKGDGKHGVLRTYYTAAIRSLIDHCAPALTCLRDDQVTNMEVIQNNALMTMLGAPMWTRICNLQMETGLPPLTARVKQITVATLVKICTSSKPSTTKVKIRVAYHRDQRTRGTSWLHMAANIIHAYRAETSTLQTEDAPHHRYSLPPPWDPPPATFEVTALGDKKSSLQQEDIRRLTLT